MIDESNDRMHYAKYTQTSEWKQLRNQALERDGNRCRLCNTDKNLNVHHRVYPKHGWRTDCIDNLTTLCKSCHSKHHDKMQFDNRVSHNTKNSLLVWNAIVENDRVIGSDLELLTNWPNHSRQESDKRQCSLFACERRIQEADFNQRKILVALTFIHLCIVYNFDPFVVHEKFMRLSEYCDGMSDEVIYKYKHLVTDEYLDERGL